MKVLHLVSRYRWTGAAEPAVHLCRFLARAGVDSRMCCVFGGSLESRARDLGTNLAHATHLGRDYTPWGILSSARRLAFFLDSEQVAIVHAHTSHDHWLAALALRIFARGSTRLVRTHHETRRIRTGRIWRRIFNDLTAINIVVSRASASFFTDSGAILPSNLRVIYGGLDMSQLKPSLPSSSVRSVWGVPPDAQLLAHLSHIGPDRRQNLMLEAFTLVAEEYPRAWLVFLGQGNRSTVRELKEKTSKLACGDRIFFNRDFAGRGLSWPDQLAAVDLVGVLAVGSEGSSRGVMEAMTLGKPVIGARVGVIPELIQAEKTGWLVEIHGADRLAAAIREGLGDSRKALRMGGAAALEARKYFRCERQARQTLDLYQELLSPGEKSSSATG